MPIRQKIRWLIAIGVLLLTLVLLLFIFFATQTVIGVWHELQTVPDWLFYTYMFVIGLATVTSLGIILRLLLPSFKKSKKEPPPDAASIENELAQAESDGVDITHIRQELAKLQARKTAGQVYVSLFGDVSTGKSSLIKALVPDANIETHVRGGSTQTVTEYQWQLPNAEDSLCLIDLPGRNEAAGQWEKMVEEEALRAQVVVYVTDTDLTRSQFDDIQILHGFNKPLIIAVNKCDRYQSDEQDQLRQRIVDVCTQMDKAAKQTESPDSLLPSIPFINNHSSWQVVFTSAGGMEMVTKIYPDGREEKVLRERKPKINALIMALQDKIDQQYETLDQLCDASVFVLTQRKLDSARESFRQEQAGKIIQQSTRHAILGAMAAISPGTDLIIQGVLATRMIQQLCKLYDVPVRQLDIDRFLDFSQNQMKKSTPLILAVVGNGFKAFPGVGTLAGGLIQAVAYGIIFDTLGKAVHKTLETRGALKPAPAAISFKEMLSENMESRAKTFAKLVLEERKKSA